MIEFLFLRELSL